MFLSAGMLVWAHRKFHGGGGEGAERHSGGEHSIIGGHWGDTRRSGNDEEEFEATGK